MKKYLKSEIASILEQKNNSLDENATYKLSLLGDSGIMSRKIFYIFALKKWQVVQYMDFFSKNILDNGLLYDLNADFYILLKENHLTSEKIGIIVDEVLKVNFAKTKRKKFLISDLSRFVLCGEELRKIHGNKDEVFCGLLASYLVNIPYQRHMKVTQEEIDTFEKYIKTISHKNELYKRVYKTIINLLENNNLSPRDLKNKLRVLMHMVDIDENFIDDYFAYLDNSIKLEKNIPKKVTSKDVPTISRKEARKQLAKYYDLSTGEVSQKFDYANFKEVLMLLKNLNMVEERNNVVFLDLCRHALLNEAYFDYLYQKLQFQLPEEETLKLIDEYLGELKNCNEEDALFWRREINNMLLSYVEPLQINFAYENEELKRCKRL